MSVPVRERFVHTSDGRVHVRESGEGPSTLVMLHGWTRTSLVWQSTLETCPEGWRGIAPDLAVRSDPPGGGYNIASLVKRTLALLAALRTGPLLLAGHSMGGAVAIEVARKGADVESLVLVGTGTRPPGHHRGSGAIKSLVERGKSSETMSSILEAWFHRRPSAARFAVILEEAMQWPYEALIGMRASRDSSDLQSKLATLAMPVLVIHGEADAVRSLDEAKEMSRAAPNGRLVVLHDVGHTPTEEDPAGTASVIWDFAQSNRPRPRHTGP
ncbi:MAG: alpha/beta fold hydrolase [Acidimicrobiales bacterium]